MKNNQNFIYGIAVVTFGAMTIGWIEKGSGDWGGTKPESVAVSYTHLDVYKRQPPR